MSHEIREESGVEGYIDNLKNNGVNLNMEQAAEIIRSSISNQGYIYALESDLCNYIDICEESGYVKFYDREFDQDSQMEAVDLIRKDFLKKHLPDLMNSKHEWAFDTDGSMYEKLTNEQALEISNDYPPSVFLMDEPNYQAVMNDREIVKSLIVGYGVSLKFASDELKADKELIMDAVKKNGFALEYAKNDLNDDKEVVLVAVKQNGSALKFASNELKADKEIVLESIKENSYSFQFASDKLKSHKGMVLEAIKKNAFALGYASDDIKRIVGDGDAVHILTKAINSEKLSAKLCHELKPKQDKQLRMKI